MRWQHREIILFISLRLAAVVLHISSPVHSFIVNFGALKMSVYSNSRALARLGCRLARYSSSKPAEEIKKLVTNNKVVVFMKGVPEQPQCGFSNAVVQVLRMHAVPYEAHNVLADEALRQGVKDYSNWPTIPQVYINGEFVGGCDILLQLHQSGDLIEELEKVGIRSALLDAPAPKQPQK